MAETMSQPPVPAPPPPAWRRRARLPLMALGVLAVAGGALYSYLAGGRYESTDDAYVKAAQVAISANVAGRVTELAVHDNQAVHRGDLLYRLDEAPFKIGVQEAEAKFAAARLEVESLKANYRQRQADIAAARDTLAYRQREYERQERLQKSGIASQSQVDRALHAMEDARSRMASTQQEASAVAARLGGNPTLDVEHHPLVLQAKAALDRARLNLSYTTVRAPADGVVTRVEDMQVGNFVPPSQPVFALVSTTDVWLEANFKEDQLQHMRPGQIATITIDSYPDHTFRGRVASVSPGTGSQFSALPPENATGNWVKVVQRLPVRIELDPSDAQAAQLHSGLSAAVDVDTRYQRHLFDKSTVLSDVDGNTERTTAAAR